MKTHCIDTLARNILFTLPITDELKTKWKKSIIDGTIYYQRILYEQSIIDKILVGMPYAIIKGTSVAQYYPDPNLRALGDIDILIGEDYFDCAEVKLAEKYNADSNVCGLTTTRHISFHSENIQLELHRYVYDTISKNRAEYSNRIMQHALHNTSIVTHEGMIFRTLPKYENGLIILQHISHHLQTGIGLRHIIDWMFFLNNHVPIDWDSFNSATKELGLFKLQCALTKIGIIYFELDAGTHISWCNSIDDITCKQLMEYICSRGNFGNKTNSYADRLAIKNLNKHVIRRLEAGGLYRWPLARKYAIFRPFAWIYQACRLIKELLGKKNLLGYIVEEFNESKAIESLLTELGIDLIDASNHGESQ